MLLTHIIMYYIHAWCTEGTCYRFVYMHWTFQVHVHQHDIDLGPPKATNPRYTTDTKY